MIFKIDLEKGLVPVVAARIVEPDGTPVRTVEQAIVSLNSTVSCQEFMFRMYGRAAAGRKPAVYGMLKHQDGLVQLLIEASDLASACDDAIKLLCINPLLSQARRTG